MLPRLLGGVQVSINGSPVPLLYVSDTQVNAVAPLFLSGSTARVRVSFNGVEAPDFVATVVAALPEVFQRGDGTAAAINQDGSINSAEHPAPGLPSGHRDRVHTVWPGWQDSQLPREPRTLDAVDLRLAPRTCYRARRRCRGCGAVIQVPAN
jgi:hypothetical protein